MPTYSFEVDGQKHSFTTDQALSDEDLSAAIGQLSTPSAPAKTAAPPPGVPTKPVPGQKSLADVDTPKHLSDADVYASAGETLRDLGQAAGAETARLFAGVGQLYEGGVNYLGSKMGVPEDKQTHVMTNLGDQATAAAQAVEGKNPAAALGGETVPMAAGGAVVPAVRAATVPGRIAQATGAGALAGAAQPVPGGEDLAKGKAINMAEGGAINALVTAGGEGLSKVKNKVNEILFGHTGDQNSPVRALAKKAEDLGFKINPQQRREDAGRLQTPGISFQDREQNTLKANQLASAATGQETNKITSEYIGERYTDLGKQFDEVYAPGKTFKIDASVLPGLQQMVADEANAGRPFASTPAVQAANRILDAFGGVQNSSGAAKVTKMNVDGPDIQRLRDQVSKLAYKTSDPHKKDALLDVVNAIDESAEKNNPEVADRLKELRPKYRSLSTLDTLAKSGGIDSNGNISPAKLGEHLRSKDPNYTKDKSTHPLAELGELGETFGIRGMNEANIVGGGSTARAKPEDIATHAGRFRMAMEHARDLPGVRQSMQSGFENKIYGMNGYGLSQEDLKAVNATMLTMQQEERKREATNR